MSNKNTKTRREVLIWVTLLVISMAAALVVNMAIERFSNPLATLGGEGVGEDVNFREVLKVLLYEHFIMSLKIFGVLGIGRLIFLFASNRIRFKNAS